MKLSKGSGVGLILLLGSNAWSVEQVLEAPVSVTEDPAAVSAPVQMKRVDQLRASRLRLEVQNEEAFKERLEYLRLQDERHRLDRFLPAPTDTAQK